MHTVANTEDQDEILHNVAFHLDLHYLLLQKQSSAKEIHILFGNMTRDVSIYILMGHAKLIMSNQKVKPIYSAKVLLFVCFSESIRGEKFDIAKGVAKTVINTLTKQDYVNKICARLMSGSLICYFNESMRGEKFDIAKGVA